MDDESGESMEPMEKAPLKGLGESELERFGEISAGVDGEKQGVVSRRKSNLLYHVRQTSMYCSVLLTVILTDVVSVVSPAA